MVTVALLSLLSRDSETRASVSEPRSPERASLASMVGLDASSQGLHTPADDVDLHARRLVALRDVCSWAPVFGGVDSAELEGFDLAVVDAVADADGSSDTSEGDVAALHDADVLVLAYLSVGTVENWRHYASAVPTEWTLGPVEGWDGERYVDARESGWRGLMVAEARTLAAAGFDGLYLDNLDVGELFPETQEGLVDLVTELRTAAPDVLLVAQNGLAVAERLPIDGIAHEDVYWRWDDGYRASTPEETAEIVSGLRLLQAGGLPVFTVDYAEPNSEGANDALVRALGEGFHPVVTTLELDRLPHTTPSC